MTLSQESKTKLTSEQNTPDKPLKTGGKSGGGVIGALYGLVAYALFSTHDAMIKSLSGLSVFQVAFFVVLFSFVPFTFFLAFERQERSLRPNLPVLVALRCLFSLGSLLCAFYAFSVLPMTEVYSLIFAAPILITLIAIPVLGEKIRIHRWMAIIVGMIGVLVVLRPGIVELGLGHAAGLAAAVCVASSAIVTRKIGAREHSVVLIMYPMLVNVIVTGLCLTLVYQPLSGQELLTLAGIGFLSVTAQSLLVKAYRTSEAQYVAPMQYSQMLWAIVFGWLVFNEPVDRFVILGSAIIGFSGLLFLWRELVASVHKPLLRTRNLRMTPGPQMASSETDEYRSAGSE